MKKVMKRRESVLPSATVCFTTVVRSFVTHHCGAFSWQSYVLGLLRSRSFDKLLEHAESVNSELIDSCTRGESQHKVYADASSFELATQYVALIRSYQFTPEEIPGLDPDAAAIRDFLGAERRNKRLNNLFRAHLNRGTERHWCIPFIRDVFCRVLGRTPPYEDIFDKCDYSGGASVGLSGDDTHMANKLCATVYRGTPTALEYYKHAIRRNFHYSQVLSCEPTGCFNGTQVIGAPPYFNRVNGHIDQRFVNVAYDEIKVVPKKAKSGRTIGKNPPINNFVQKGIDLVMRDRLRRRLGIDLSDQLTNQCLSEEGSEDNFSDPYVTIDVRGASNSVLTELVRSVTPPRWFKMLNQTRSPSYRITDLSFDEIPYEMFVSMGNGFCFPLESLLFAAIVLAAYDYAGAIPDYNVYGDDIIVRQSVALVVIECLRACGFRVNVDKTYIFGPFRESCGANWYDGRLVTPGYYKERITSLSKLHALHNSLSRYPFVQEAIRGLQKSGVVHVVPDTKAWSFVTDQAYRVPYDNAIGNPEVYFDREKQCFVYPILVSSPVADNKWQLGRPASDGSVEMLKVAAALRGSTYEEPFHLRRATRYKSTNTMDPVVAKEAKLTKKLAKHGSVWY